MLPFLRSQPRRSQADHLVGSLVELAEVLHESQDLVTAVRSSPPEGAEERQILLRHAAALAVFSTTLRDTAEALNHRVADLLQHGHLLPAGGLRDWWQVLEEEEAEADRG